MTRTWRLESAALLGLWALATALLVAAAGPSGRPVRAEALAHATGVTAPPSRRPPTTQPADPDAPADEPPTAGEDEAPASEAEPHATDSVEVTELDPLEISSDGEDYAYEGYEEEPFDENLDYYRTRYASRFGDSPARRWWLRRRGRVLPSAASAFLADRPVLLGMSSDPCDVLPAACTDPSAGGAYLPPVGLRAPAPGAVAHRGYGSPATVTRTGDLWHLVNDLVTIDLDALCRIVARPADASTPAIVALAPPAAVACARRETAAPWDDRAGAAVELTWTSPIGSMRVVVALADDGAAAEASVARTDALGATWLANLGASALTWTVAGRDVTVAPGGAVRVSARRSARP